MKRIALVVVLGCSLWQFSAQSAFPEEVKESKLVLTLEQCVAVALEEHPQLQIAEKNVDAYMARVRQAAADGRAKISAATSYSYSHTDGKGESGQYQTSVTLKQPVYDWNRRELKLDQAKLSLEAVSHDKTRNVESVVRTVEEAYYQINSYNRALVVAEERRANFEKRLKWARDFYSVGTKPRIEVSSAQTDYSNAQLNVTVATTNLEKGYADLAAAMGTPDIRGVQLLDMLDYKSFSVSYEEALMRAMEQRADLKAEKVRIAASEKALGVAQRGLSPELNASAGYYTYGESDPLDKNDWRLQFDLSIPLTDGGLTRAQTEQASADVAMATAKKEQVQQGIIRDVRKALYSLEGARMAIAATQDAERYAKERLDLAMGRYRAGVGNSLEVSDAIESYANSRSNSIKALYDFKAARLEIEYVMGGKSHVW